MDASRKDTGANGHRRPHDLAADTEAGDQVGEDKGTRAVVRYEPARCHCPRCGYPKLKVSRSMHVLDDGGRLRYHKPCPKCGKKKVISYQAPDKDQ